MLSQVEFINAEIDRPRWRRLHGLTHVWDLSDQTVEVLIQCMEWNIMTHRRSIPESELPEVHQAAVDLLELLKKNLPDSVARNQAGTSKRHTASCTRSARLCCGATLTTPAARGQSMLISN